MEAEKYVQIWEKIDGGLDGFKMSDMRKGNKKKK